MHALASLCLLAANSFTAAERLSWDFEDGLGGWKVWGTTREMGSTAGVLTLSTDSAHAGKRCLCINDCFANGNPYAVFVAPVDAAKTYVFSGYIRAPETTGAAPHVWIMPVSKSDGREKALKSLGPDPFFPFGVGKAWQRFRFTLPKLNPETTHVYLAIRPAQNSDPKWQGKLWVDELAFFPQEFKPLDLSPVANRGFRDRAAGAQSDPQDIDLRGIHGGPLPIAGLTFKILDPAQNGGKSVLALRSDRAPAVAAVKVDAHCDFLYLLHTAAGVAADAAVGSASWRYADGSTRSTAVVCGDQVGDWRDGRVRSAFSKAYDELNPSVKPLHLFAAGLANPAPEKPVTSVVLKPAEQGRALWLVLAAEIGVGDNVVELARAAARDPAKWKPFAPGLKTAAAPLLDLSFLLDAPAGKHGFVKSVGGHFAFEDGTPARFVGVNIHSHQGLLPSKEQAQRVARTLSRYGVNLVRLHLMEYVLIDETRPDRQTPAPDQVWDRFDYLVKCFKDRGIYIELDSLSGLSANRPAPDAFPGAADYPGHRAWWTYHPKLQELGRAWTKVLLTHHNRYTGNRLVDEPAVALMMLVNEQSIFFDWKETAKPTPPAIRQILTQRYNEWLVNRFGNRASLAKAWRGSDGQTLLQADEDPIQGTVTCWELYSLILTQRVPPDGQGRLAPPRQRTLMQFLKELQTDVYTDYIAFLKTLGLKVPVAGSNIEFDLADLETCRATGFTSQNMYYEHASHVGKALGFANVPEMLCDPISSGKLVHPGIAAAKLNNLPVTSTEHDTMWPQEWRSAHNLSVYSQAAFQNWDAMFWYCYMGGYGLSWDDAEKMTAVSYPTVEFNDAALAGLLPAAALLYHRRDVAPGRRLVQVVYNPELVDVFGPRVRAGGFPWNYLTWVSRVEGVFGQPDGRAAFTVGPGGPHSMRLGAEDLLQPAADQARMLDAALKKEGLIAGSQGLQEGRVVSDTGELVRNWKEGLLLIDTPRTQAFSGFPAAAVKLHDVTVKLNIPFATIAVQSLDSAPIAAARKLLLTAVARVENDRDTVAYGQIVPTPNGAFRGERLLVTPAAKRGLGARARMELVDATISIAGGALRLTPIAADGSALEAASLCEQQQGSAQVKLGRHATIWYLLERP